MNSGIALLADGFRLAGRRLAQLSSNRIAVHVTGGRIVPLTGVGPFIGGEDRHVCAAIVGIHVGPDERMPQMRFIIAVSPETRRRLTAILAGEKLADDPRMSASVIQEIANIAASAIANHLSGQLGLPVHATAPDVVEDLWGPLLMGVIGSFGTPHDDIALVTTEVQADRQRCDCIACLIADDGTAITHLDRPSVVRGV